MKKITVVILLIIVAALGLLVVGGVFNLGQPYSAHYAAMPFAIIKGESVNTISQDLADAKIIKSAWYFSWYAKWHNLRSKIMAGTYELSPSFSSREILERITRGDVINNENIITIIPGWNLSDIERYLASSSVVTASDFLKIRRMKVGDWNLGSTKPDFLSDAPANASLEGFLFPDTYRIFKNAAANDVAQKMLDNFNIKLTPQLRADITKQGKSIYDIITVASIVEKEVKSRADMAVVSGIFWERLADGTPLQSDATLSYVLNDKNDQHSISDLGFDSPFNTYKYRGLPPGPICNPGLNAIRAAIYPEATDYYYFLTRPDTGATVFSKTYQEHLKNKAKYLK